MNRFESLIALIFLLGLTLCLGACFDDIPPSQSTTDGDVDADQQKAAKQKNERAEVDPCQARLRKLESRLGPITKLLEDSSWSDPSIFDSEQVAFIARLASADLPVQPRPIRVPEVSMKVSTTEIPCKLISPNSLKMPNPRENPELDIFVNDTLVVAHGELQKQLNRSLPKAINKEINEWKTAQKNAKRSKIEPSVALFVPGDAPAKEVALVLQALQRSTVKGKVDLVFLRKNQPAVTRPQIPGWLRGLCGEYLLCKGEKQRKNIEAVAKGEHRQCPMDMSLLYNKMSPAKREGRENNLTFDEVKACKCKVDTKAVYWRFLLSLPTVFTHVVPIQISAQGVDLGLKASTQTWSEASEAFVPIVREELSKSEGKRILVRP